MKIAVLLSGGVDSSVALARLHEQGHDITAFYLKIWLEDELSFLGDCPWEQDLSYARGVCEKLGIPLEVVPLQKEYHERIVSYTVAEVQAGRTPSPDVLCNTRIKFGAFLEAVGKNFDAVASGHYAQIIKTDGDVQLRRSPDAVKDQTYFLAHLSSEQLAHIMLPIGDLQKEEVRALAHKYDLPTKDRKDSQGICFLGKISFAQFIEHYLGTKPGDIVELETGHVLGQHKGFWFHTIGQRKGLGLSGGPWFVVRKDTEKNIVYVSRDYFSPDKKRDSFIMRDVHWITGQRPDKQELRVKVRHGPHDQSATLTYHDDGTVHVQLTERDQGLASGQFAVFYDNDICLGCGVIES